MMLKDRYGNELSTASTAARDAYVRGVDSLMAATTGTDTAFADAIAADEGFALAHISLARAKQLLGRGHEAKAPRARALCSRIAAAVVSGIPDRSCGRIS